MLKLNYFLADIFILSAEKQPIKLSWRKIEWLRYIEVKGRAGTDGVMLSENEWNRLAQLGDKAWLYIVINCKTAPELYRIQNPAIRLTFEKVSKGVQYYLPLKEWQQKYEQ